MKRQLQVILLNLKHHGQKINKLFLTGHKILLLWTCKNPDKSLLRFLQAKAATGTIKKTASRFSKKVCLPSQQTSRNLAFQQLVLHSGHIQNMLSKKKVKLRSTFLEDSKTSSLTITLQTARAIHLNSFISQKLRNGSKTTGKVSKSLQTLKKTGKCTKSSAKSQKTLNLKDKRANWSAWHAANSLTAKWN